MLIEREMEITRVQNTRTGQGCGTIGVLGRTTELCLLQGVVAGEASGYEGIHWKAKKELAKHRRMDRPGRGRPQRLRQWWVGALQELGST